ncbi:MAG: fibronectin type III domain-containing protein [candidate division WOR-3 bacterium]|nr:MAG: fibronectin type III domain-containing protein [candidate division WOR-3 bacterium]
MMKRLAALGTIGTLCLAVLVLTGCEDGVVGSAPTNFALVAGADGITVVLSWEEPTEGEPDGYIVYFREVNTTDWVVGDSLDATEFEFTHDPGELTGDYMIAAYWDEDEFETDELTTVPIHTSAVSIYELNAAGNSGYGWAIAGDFTGSTYSMAQVANAPLVDFYVTDFAPGTGASDWAIATPDLAPTDPGGVTPADNWRTSWFTDPIVDPQAALPAYGPTTFFNYTEGIEVDPTYIGVFLDDEEHFALVKFSGVNPGDGSIQVETWFQTVQGLRLIAH